MKRIILIFCFVLFVSFMFVDVRAEEFWGRINVDNYRIEAFDTSYIAQVNSDRTKYRIKKFNGDIVEFIVGGLGLNRIKFYSNNDSLFIIGSYIERNDETNGVIYYPFIFRCNKDLNVYSQYIFNDVEKNDNVFSYVSSAIVGEDNSLYISVGININRNSTNNFGSYNIYHTDSEYNINNEFSLTCEEISLSYMYDLIKVNSKSFSLYLDRDLNTVNKVNDTSIIKGSFELLEDLYMNEELKEIGSVISEPGKYRLSYNNSNKDKEIIIEPKIIVIGSVTDGYYDDYFEYRVSGGTVSINDKNAYLSGRVSSPGIYTIKVIGIDDYIYEETFKIKSKLITDIENRDLNIGDEINFEGEAKLNNKIIEDGYVISEAGEYTIDLYVGEEIVSSYTFDVKEKDDNVVTKKSVLNTMSIILLILIVLLVITLIIVEIIDKRKKKGKK